MNSFRKLPQIEDFEGYRPSAQALAKARAHDYRPADTLSRSQKITTWVCRVTAAVIMLETLFFKFTGAAESVYIFTKMALVTFSSGFIVLMLHRREMPCYVSISSW